MQKKNLLYAKWAFTRRWEKSVNFYGLLFLRLLDVTQDMDLWIYYGQGQFAIAWNLAVAGGGWFLNFIG